MGIVTAVSAPGSTYPMASPATLANQSVPSAAASRRCAGAGMSMREKRLSWTVYL